MSVTETTTFEFVPKGAQRVIDDLKKIAEAAQNTAQVYKDIASGKGGKGGGGGGKASNQSSLSREAASNAKSIANSESIRAQAIANYDKAYTNLLLKQEQSVVASELQMRNEIKSLTELQKSQVIENKISDIESKRLDIARTLEAVKKRNLDLTAQEAVKLGLASPINSPKQARQGAVGMAKAEAMQIQKQEQEMFAAREKQMQQESDAQIKGLIQEQARIRKQESAAYHTFEKNESQKQAALAKQTEAEIATFKKLEEQKLAEIKKQEASAWSDFEKQMLKERQQMQQTELSELTKLKNQEERAWSKRQNETLQEQVNLEKRTADEVAEYKMRKNREIAEGQKALIQEIADRQKAFEDELSSPASMGREQSRLMDQMQGLRHDGGPDMFEQLGVNIKGTGEEPLLAQGIAKTGKAAKASTGQFGAMNTEVARMNDTVRLALGPLSGVATRLTALSNIATQANLSLAAFVGTMVGTAGLLFATTRVSANLDRLDKQAQRMGVSFDELRKIQFIGMKEGVNDLEGALERMNQRIGEITQGAGGQARRALSELGINFRDLSNLAPSEQLAMIADGFQNVNTTAEKAAITQALFSRGYTEMSTMLNRGSAAVTQNADQFEMLGLTLGQETAMRATELTDTMTAAGAVIRTEFNAALMEGVGSARQLGETIVNLRSAVQGLGTAFGVIAKNSDVLLFMSMIGLGTKFGSTMGKMSKGNSGGMLGNVLGGMGLMSMAQGGKMRMGRGGAYMLGTAAGIGIREGVGAYTSHQATEAVNFDRGRLEEDLRRSQNMTQQERVDFLKQIQQEEERVRKILGEQHKQLEANNETAKRASKIIGPLTMFLPDSMNYVVGGMNLLTADIDKIEKSTEALNSLVDVRNKVQKDVDRRGMPSDAVAGAARLAEQLQTLRDIRAETEAIQRGGQLEVANIAAQQDARKLLLGNLTEEAMRVLEINEGTGSIAKFVEQIKERTNAEGAAANVFGLDALAVDDMVVALEQIANAMPGINFETSTFKQLLDAVKENFEAIRREQLGLESQKFIDNAQQQIAIAAQLRAAIGSQGAGLGSIRQTMEDAEVIRSLRDMGFNTEDFDDPLMAQVESAMVAQRDAEERIRAINALSDAHHSLGQRTQWLTAQTAAYANEGYRAAQITAIQAQISQQAGLDYGEYSKQTRALAEETVELEEKQEMHNLSMQAYAENGRIVTTALTDGMHGALAAWMNGTQSMGDAFRNLTAQVLTDISRIFFRMAMLQLIGGPIGGFSFGLFGGGGDDSGGGGAQAYAKGGIMGRNGGVLTRPTVFPMANGMGLAGEAGDEAVVPLTHEDLGRDASGRMGVKNRGGGNVLPVMVTDKESLERLTSSDDFDEMMARMLQRPNSRARQALRM